MSEPAQPSPTDPHGKAFAINIDPTKYGALAEIGAGQEVARWFFRVGGASSGIAKTMSAYDMEVSDAIYGPGKRYVSRQRLEAMLDHEFPLLIDRLDKSRGESTTFFAFADTVTATSYSRKQDGDAWLGIRFQTKPRAEPSQIIIHARLLDPDNLPQQEAIGILGVNLIHAAMFHFDQPFRLLDRLIENINPGRAEVDMIEFSGPSFSGVDNRLMALHLVKRGLTSAAMFLANGTVVQPSDILYKKALLIERGSFRPVTNVTENMLKNAKAMFVKEARVAGDEIEMLMEMTLKNLADGKDIDHEDFLDRADLLGALGHNVLISNFGEFHKLAAYLFRYTKKMIGVVMGIPTLRELFDEKFYSSLEGGILESFGRLFKNDLKLYAYPWRDPATGELIAADNLQVAPHLRHLYAYLAENQFIAGINSFDEDCLPIYSWEVLAKIRKGDSAWEKQVPPRVAEIIKERQLFDYLPESIKI